MKRLLLTALTGSIFTLSGLTSCAQSPSSTMSESAFEAESGAVGSAAPTSDAAAPQAEGQKSAANNSAAQNTVAQNTVAQNTATSPAPAGETNATERPQLIKRADLVLSVDSVEESFEQVRAIINSQQGDLLALNDFGDRQRQLTSEFRVPQQNLDATLDALAGIGSMRSRSISTEDVSGQLVDLQARLSNSRKSEEALKEIMSRSGDIADVLEVSRELSNVRQSIEQMTAAQKSLQTQVRYSTISLTMESAIALSPTKPAFSRQLSNSWEAATSSVGEFTTGLLQIGLWLLAYSPYLAVLLCGAVVVNKVRRTARNINS